MKNSDEVKRGLELEMGETVAVVVVVRWKCRCRHIQRHAFLPSSKFGGANWKGQQGIQWALLLPHKAAKMTPPQLSVASACAFTNMPINKPLPLHISAGISKHSRLFSSSPNTLHLSPTVRPLPLPFQIQTQTLKPHLLEAFCLPPTTKDKYVCTRCRDRFGC